MLSIELKASRSLTLIILAMHALTFILALSLPLPFFVKLAAAPLLAASLLYSVRGEARRAMAGSVTAIMLLPDGGIEVQTRRRGRQAAKLQAGSFVTPQLTVLRYRLKDRFISSHVVIFPDAVEAEDFRRLRVHLRWRTLT
jgi:toxin CptA